QLSPPCGKGIQVDELAEADARREVGEVRLAAEDVDLHAVFAGARHALEAKLFAKRDEVRGRQDQGAAFRRGDVLVGVEAEGHEIAETADRAALPRRAEGLRRILYHAQAVLPGNAIERVAVDRQAGEIHGNDGLGPGGYRFFDQGQVDVPRVRIHVDEDRARAELEHDVRGRDPRERRGDHLVARADAGEAQRDLQRDRAGDEAAHRAAAAVARERFLERLHLRAGSDPARAQHVRDAGDGRLVDRRPRERQECGPGTRHERATMNTPRTMIPIPARRIGESVSPRRYHAANAFTT